MRAPCKIALLFAAVGLSAACAPPGAPYYHTQNGALVGSAIGSQMDYRDQQIDYLQARQGYYDDDAGFAPPPPNRYRPPAPDDYGSPPAYDSGDSDDYAPDY